MTSRPIPNSITLADLEGLPAPTALVETPFAELRDEQLAIFTQHIPLWDAHPDRPLYSAIELFSAAMYAAQGYFNNQIAQMDPRQIDDANLQLIGALFGVLKREGEDHDTFLLRVLNRQADIQDTGTYLGLISAMKSYPDLPIASAHAAIESTNRDVINCYALKLDLDGAKQPLSDAERAAFGSYTAPVAPPRGTGQPMTDGYLNGRDVADFGRFYRLQPVATVEYTASIKVFFDDTLHTQAVLDDLVRDEVVKWAFQQDEVGQELRPRLLEAVLIGMAEGVHDAKVTLATTPSIAPDADEVYPPADDRHYRGPRGVMERMDRIILTFETL